MAIFRIVLYLFVGFLFAFTSAQEPEISELRKLLNEGAEKEAAAEKLFQMVGNYSGNDALLMGYKASAFALHAKYASNPFTKLKSIKTSSSIFSEAVSRDNKNLEVRFMRFAVEAQTPGFLSGLRTHLKEDQGFLITALKTHPKSGFTNENARIARNFILQFGDCSNQDKESLRKINL